MDGQDVQNDFNSLIDSLVSTGDGYASLLMYRCLLFVSAWKALSKSIRDEFGMRSAAAKVLHTWNQRLEQHAHIHALVPGSGPSIDGKPGLAWYE